MRGIASILEAAGVHVQRYKANDAASAATDPRHGPINLLRGNPMNIETDTMSAPTPAIDLENYLHELHDMTSIASSLLEDGLGGEHHLITQRKDCYHLTTRQRDLLFFATYRVETLARDLITHFEKGAFK